TRRSKKNVAVETLSTETPVVEEPKTETAE
ncbi:hypothetical protein EVA_21692, partial [gut metagenome]